MSPAVTFVIPSYNQASWAKECFRSLQAQTFTDWEAVVVDDCSPDGDVLRQVVEDLRDPRFRLIRQARNQGPAAARNTGIREARGEFVVCVDCDDKLAPTYLETFSAELRSDTGLDGVFGDFIRFDGAGYRKRIRASIPTERQVLTVQTLHSCGILMRRDLVPRAGWYDEHPVLRGREDTELFIRIFTGGFKLKHVPVALYDYRIHASLNRQARRIEHQSRQYICSKHLERYERLDLVRPFMAAGYSDTSLAALFDGKRARAIRYSWKAAVTRPAKFVPLLLFCLLPLPSPAAVWLRRRWLKLIRGARGAAA